ncbi:hypothetical protein LguiA_013235 [Lonicera macranthoides]
MLCWTNANPFFLDFCIYRSFEIDLSFFLEKLESNFPRIHPFFFVVFKSIEDNANFKLGG